MISQIKTLGATEFINSFYNFARNDFKANEKNIETNNISFDGTYGTSRDLVGFASFLSALSRGNDASYQESATEWIEYLNIK